jgi:hypothetical protein
VKQLGHDTFRFAVEVEDPNAALNRNAIRWLSLGRRNLGVAERLFRAGVITGARICACAW